MTKLLPWVLAADSPFSQTDWSHGVGESTVYQYSSATGIDAISVAGVVSLAPTSGWSTSYSNWNYRKKITFNNTDANLGVGAESLQNFPVLVKLDNVTDIDYSKTQNSGQDIRFTDSDGTPLNYEIEKWDETGSSYVWVKVPQIDINSNTDFIYIYYGNTTASDSQNVTDVWDSSYKGVWHLKESPAGAGPQIMDSTSYNNDGTSGGVMTSDDLVSGQIGNSLDFDGINDFINILDSNSLDVTGTMTIEAWISPSSLSDHSYHTVLGKAYASAFWFGLYDKTGRNQTWFSGGARISPNNLFTVDSWQHIVSTYSGGSLKMYRNGVLDTTINGLGALLTNTTSLHIGADREGATDPQYNFTGKIDEARISNAARSAAYIAAQYHSETDSFNTYSAEESKYPASGSLTSNVFDADVPADWGVLTYTASGSGSVIVKARTTSNLGVAWSTCDSISSGTDISANNCIDDTDQTIQYYLELQPSGASSPIFEVININFSASDSIPPSVNATNVSVNGYKTADSWTSSAEITWTEGEDDEGGIGLLGYCIAVQEASVEGISEVLNPTQTSGILNGADDLIDITCTGDEDNPGYIVTGSSFDLTDYAVPNKKYIISLKAIDLAGNIYPDPDYVTYNQEWSDLLTFKYDGNAPTNVSYITTPTIVFGNVADMIFSWPASGGSSSVDNESGTLGWQYQINTIDSGSWQGTDTHAGLGIKYIPYNDGDTSSYDLTEGDDGGSISVGTNTVYFRTVDNTGNYSSVNTYRTAPLEYGGEAPYFDISCAIPTGITVTPNSGIANSFAISWDSANATGDNSVDGYYYMVNELPPSTLSTLTGNSTKYISASSNQVATNKLVGSVKGSNTVYVVAIDTLDNYSPSNCIKGTYNLNSTYPDAAQNLTVADSSVKANKIWRASLSWDEPTYQGTGVLTYLIERSTDNSNWTSVSTTTGTSYTDTTPSSATYYYRIGVYDSSNDSQENPTYTTSVSIYPKGTYTEAPTLSSDPVVSDLTTLSSTISWTTSRVADSRIQYGTSSEDYFDEEASKSEQVTSHSISLTNLKPGTKYYYKVKWTDEDGNIGTASEEVFSTDPAPSVAQVTTTGVSINSVIVNFTLANAAQVTIQYGPSTAYGGSKTISTSTSETEYTTQLTGLTDNTLYHYRLIMEDTENQEYQSDDYTFTTLPKPQVSNIRIQQVKNTAQPAVLISWDTNTELTSLASYYPSNGSAGVLEQVDSELKKGTHKMLLKGLLTQTPYSLIVSGRDKVGNEAVSNIQSFTTSTDTRPPYISDLTVEGTILPSMGNEMNIAQLVVTWYTDELATSQIEYGEGTGNSYSQKTQEDSNLTYNHMVIVSGLVPARVYHFKATSKDSAGNITESIDTVTITPKATDKALDLVISNLKRAFGFLGKIK